MSAIGNRNGSGLIYDPNNLILDGNRDENDGLLVEPTDTRPTSNNNPTTNPVTEPTTEPTSNPVANPSEPDGPSVHVFHPDNYSGNMPTIHPNVDLNPALPTTPIANILTGGTATMDPNELRLIQLVASNPEAALSLNYADSIRTSKLRRKILEQNPDAGFVFRELSLRISHENSGFAPDDVVPLDQPAVLAPLLNANPLLIDTAPFNRHKKALLRTYASVAEKYHQIQGDLAKHGMENIQSRVRSLALIEELINNAKTSAADDPRPSAVVLFSKHDAREQLGDNSIEDTAKHYRVTYREVENDNDFTETLAIKSKEKAPKLLLIAGTFDKNGVQLGRHNVGSLFSSFFGGGGDKVLDASDLQGLVQAGVQLADDASVVFQLASETFISPKANTELARAFQKAFPGRTVFSPEEPGFATLKFDRDGEFYGVNYATTLGPAEVYNHIPDFEGK